MVEVGVDDQNGDDFVNEVYADAPVDRLASGRKSNFAPWHHPIKQIVRQKQWSALTFKLFTDDRSEAQRKTLRYFTLPGADLLDVRVLSGALAGYKTTVEYFGFNADTGDLDAEQSEDRTASFAAESGLRQSGMVADTSQVFNDRLEDIAVEGSQADNNLTNQLPFDVINIDACDHLGYTPVRRDKTTFDAMERLLAHQLVFRKPWLLFVTTRADPSILGPHFTKMQSAVSENMKLHFSDFGAALAQSLEVELDMLQAEIDKSLAAWSMNFLKLYSVGLGKYLLHYFHMQKPVAADVELKSVYTYRIKGEKPDMLSFAFRVVPKPIKAQPASIGGATVNPIIESRSGVRIAKRVARLWLLDEAIAVEADVRSSAVTASAKLLGEANYDLDLWRVWLADHAVRPMVVTSEEIA